MLKKISIGSVVLLLLVGVVSWEYYLVQWIRANQRVLIYLGYASVVAIALMVAVSVAHSIGSVATITDQE